MDVQEIRRKNLRALLTQWGGPTALAKRLKHSGPSYLSQLVSGVRPITEKNARKIEERTGLSKGWLDREDGTAHASVVAIDVDTSLVTSAIIAVGTAAEEDKVHLTPEKLGDMVALVYEAAKGSNEVDPAYARKIVRLLK